MPHFNKLIFLSGIKTPRLSAPPLTEHHIKQNSFRKYEFLLQNSFNAQKLSPEFVQIWLTTLKDSAPSGAYVSAKRQLTPHKFWNKNGRDPKVPNSRSGLLDVTCQMTTTDLSPDS